MDNYNYFDQQNTLHPVSIKAFGVRLPLRLSAFDFFQKIVTARKNAGNVGHVVEVRDVGLSCV